MSYARRHFLYELLISRKFKILVIVFCSISKKWPKYVDDMTSLIFFQFLHVQSVSEESSYEECYEVICLTVIVKFWLIDLPPSL